MSEPRAIVIVGGGLAGATAAATLRDQGFDGRVVLIGEEREPPYERPPLSKSHLAGATSAQDARVHGDGFYDEHGVELRTAARASSLDIGRRRVLLAGGDELEYDRLLLATGAAPRRPPIPGADGDAVHVLRTLEDARRLRHVIEGGGRLVIVGAGWIGCEVAATARGLGADVTVVEQGARPLGRVLGDRLGDVFADLHRDHGVELLLGAGVDAIEAGGRRVRLATGREISCAGVLLGVGAAPRTALAQAAGLEVRDGVVADSRLRTAAPDIFVAGDVAAALHPRYGRPVRVEHWDNALAQGAAAARAMLGATDPFAGVPYFFSDQYDVGLEYVGLHGPDDAVVIRGEVEARRFQAFWITPDRRVSAALHMNDWDAIDTIRSLVEDGMPVDVASLADESRPLAEAAGRS